MRPKRPGAVKQLLILIDEFRCQRCQLNLSKFPELIQLHHMIDREILWKARREGMQRQFQEMRRNIEYQQILCPACHATVHGNRERDYFFPNYNVNTSGNNVKLAMDSQMKMRMKVRER
ncbi:MAG: hypothetical protein V1909_01920 [Candidatus Micrarchaeota archaeon]